MWERACSRPHAVDLSRASSLPPSGPRQVPGPIRKLAAFSLIEVVIAVAIFAGAVTVLLALLASTLRDSSDAADVQTALRLPGAVEVALREIAAREGLPALAGRVPLMDAAADRGFLLVATREGGLVRVAGAEADAAQPHGEYFLIDVRRFAAGPLAFDAARAVLPLQVRVSWPYRVLTPEGLAAPVAFAERRHVTFNLGVAP
ncbi:MAG: type II secretion system protein [Opitutaceae bacterium]|nr:type II secretion system protein [Opitutaceae bacterium]